MDKVAGIVKYLGEWIKEVIRTILMAKDWLNNNILNEDNQIEDESAPIVW